MKKFSTLTATLIAAAALSCAAVPSANAADSVNAYITINACKDAPVVTQEKIEVTDVDNDGKLTVTDALTIAHDKFFEGGAAAGFATTESTYGPMVSKLWGIENGGSYGSYVNGNMAWSPVDELADGSYLDAYVYSDMTAWSDIYCYFDVRDKDVNQGDKVTLRLSKVQFGADGAASAVPFADATVTVNGTAVGKTDAEGNIEIEAAAGKNVVSATSDTAVVVHPVAILNAAPAAEAPTAAPTEPATEAATEAATTVATTAATTVSTAAPTPPKAATTAATTAAATTAAANTNSPKTGDSSGTVFAFLGAAAVAAAFTFRKHED